MHSISLLKSALRKKNKDFRASLTPEEKTHRAESIYTHFLSLFTPMKNMKLAGYFPLPGEIDLLPLLHLVEKNHGIALLPRIISPDSALVFSLYKKNDRLIPGLKWNIPEPSPDKPCVIPDIMLVPLLAFNKKFYRLGYGSGLYDRSILYYRKSYYTLAVGIGYSEMRTESLPVEMHDSPLDAIITEEGSFFCNNFPFQATM